MRVMGSEVKFMIVIKKRHFSSPPLLDSQEVLDSLRVWRHLLRIYKQQAAVNHRLLLQLRDLSPC